MMIAIPSKGRPAKCKTAKFLPSATVFVPEAEVEDYVSLGVARVKAVPDSVKGITRTRNWILDHTNDRRVVFVDDDVRSTGWLEIEDEWMERREFTEADWLREWPILFDLTESLRFRIWGVATMSAPRACYPWKPFLFRSYVTASCMGILNDGRTRFDETFPVKEDYEICLRCIQEDGGVLAARFLFWENSHWTDEGGCRAYRTQEIERDCINRLIAKYPGMIRKVRRGGSEFSVDIDF